MNWRKYMINELIEKICQKSESIGRWREFLDKQEDWSSPYITIAQNNIRSFEIDRQNYIKQLKEFIENEKSYNIKKDKSDE
jgi:hypothetical protein